MPCLPSGTLTFLFTDIEASTRLWDERPNEMKVALRRHDEILRSALETYGGAVFKTTGDGFCAAFATARSAVLAALTAQRQLHTGQPSGPTDGVVLKTRMALHSGAAEERDGDYFGPVLNRTARLLAAGHGEQILVSGATRELLQDDIPDGAIVRDLGLHQLRSLLRPEQVFQVLHPELPAEFPPLVTVNVVRTNLPAQISSFVGRDHELAEVSRLIPTTRLLTFSGPGGCGKTRLCLEAAAYQVDSFSEGVWLVELVDLRDAALVPAAALTVLAVSEHPDRAPIDALRDYLRDRKLLLILDNCEHLVEACASLVETLLQACPGLRILTTSRTPLCIPGELNYPVPPLSVPRPGAASDRELDACDAVRLFVERARFQKPGFGVNEANAPAIVHICTRLDGIPLALELAAARVATLTVQQIASRLDDRLRLLGVGSRTAAPHQQTLRATLDWSYDLLTCAEQTLYSRVSVFAGGWTLEAAEAVCGPGEPEIDVVTCLVHLVSHSLVCMSEDEHGEGRFSMLETMREYAAQRLAASGEELEIRRRHASWAGKLAEAEEPRLRGPAQRDAIERLDDEHDNLRAALDWLLRRSSNPSDAARLASSLWRFWYARGHIQEGRAWLEEVAARFAERPGAARAKLMTALGNLCWAQHDRAEAARHFRESLDIRRSLGDQTGAANSLSNLGNVASQDGDFETARAHYQESLTILHSLGDRWGEGSALNNLGCVCKDQRDYDAALQLFEESARLYRELGDRSTLASVLNNQGQIAVRQGEIVRAARMLRESLEIRKELKDQRKLTGSLQSFAALFRAAVHPNIAAELFAASLAAARSLNMSESTANARETAEFKAELETGLGVRQFEEASIAGSNLELDEAVERALSFVRDITDDQAI